MKKGSALGFIVICFWVVLSCATKQLTPKGDFSKYITNSKIGSKNEVYELIDTTKIYKLVSLYYKHDVERLNIVTTYNYKKYLKFYPNGRLAVYDDFNILTLDTLKASVTDQGSYNYAYKTLYTKYYITNKDGKQFYNPQFHMVAGDTLCLYSESTKNTSCYIPIAIPKTVIVNKADW